MVYFIFIILWFIISLPSLIQIGTSTILFLCQCATNSGSGRVAAAAAANAKQTATVSVHTSYVVYTVLGTGEANIAAEAHENTKENK